MSELTSEQQQQKIQEDKQMRLALKQTFEQLYMNLVDFLQKLNVNPQFKAYCFLNLDQGAFWARTAIDNMQINFQSQPPAEEKPQQANQQQDAA